MQPWLTLSTFSSMNALTAIKKTQRVMRAAVITRYMIDLTAEEKEALGTMTHTERQRWHQRVNAWRDGRAGAEFPFLSSRVPTWMPRAVMQ